MESRLVWRQGQRLRIFIGEAQEWQRKPLHYVIVELAHYHGAVGAFVLRGIEGFGPEHHLSTERLVDISENLPLLIDVIIDNEHLERFLPRLDQIVQRGMVTMMPITFIAQ
jgi:uncharacterized protein